MSTIKTAWTGYPDIDEVINKQLNKKRAEIICCIFNKDKKLKLEHKYRDLLFSLKECYKIPSEKVLEKGVPYFKDRYVSGYWTAEVLNLATITGNKRKYMCVFNTKEYADLANMQRNNNAKFTAQDAEELHLKNYDCIKKGRLIVLYQLNDINNLTNIKPVDLNEQKDIEEDHVSYETMNLNRGSYSCTMYPGLHARLSRCFIENICNEKLFSDKANNQMMEMSESKVNRTSSKPIVIMPDEKTVTQETSKVERETNN